VPCEALYVATATRKEHREVEDRHDQDGPTFAASEVAVVHDRKAQIAVRMVGGPRKVVIHAEPDTPWCAGISSGEDGPPSSSIRFAPMDAGDDIRFTAHLTVNPWQGHDQIILALRFSLESQKEPTAQPGATGTGSAQAAPATTEDLVTAVPACRACL
jgi:hypothetical protein